MATVDFSTKIKGIHTAFRAQLNWSGTIKISAYITLPKGKSLRSYSYMAGGIHKVHLLETTSYDKYVRLDFEIEWNKDIFCPRAASYILAKHITNLTVE